VFALSAICSRDTNSLIPELQRFASLLKQPQDVDSCFVYMKWDKDFARLPEATKELELDEKSRKLVAKMIEAQNPEAKACIISTDDEYRTPEAVVG